VKEEITLKFIQSTETQEFIVEIPYTQSQTRLIVRLFPLSTFAENAVKYPYRNLALFASLNDSPTLRLESQYRPEINAQYGDYEGWYLRQNERFIMIDLHPEELSPFTNNTLYQSI